MQGGSVPVDKQDNRSPKSWPKKPILLPVTSSGWAILSLWPLVFYMKINQKYFSGNNWGHVHSKKSQRRVEDPKQQQNKSIRRSSEVQTQDLLETRGSQERSQPPNGQLTLRIFFVWEILCTFCLIAFSKKKSYRLCLTKFFFFLCAAFSPRKSQTRCWNRRTVESYEWRTTANTECNRMQVHDFYWMDLSPTLNIELNHFTLCSFHEDVISLYNGRII